ncbi:MAG: hypothetical protein QM820_59625 [Minicystis sp.]
MAVFTFEEMPTDGGTMTKKAIAICTCLSKHASICQFVDQGGRWGGKCPIRLIDTYNPASVHPQDDGLWVNISHYYLEKYSLGYNMGMLCHEFGVHPMGRGMGQGKTMENMIRNTESQLRDTNLGDYVVSVPGLRVVASDAPQPEHIFASVPVSPRRTIYRNTVIEMARVLVSSNSLVGSCAKGTCARGVLNRCHVADLVDCYLMDVASILATNDNRVKGVVGTHTGNIVAIYNHALDDFLANCSGEPFITHVCTQEKSWSSVMQAYGSLLLSAWGFFDKVD